MLNYYINDINITPLVYVETKISKTVGRGSNLLTNSVTLNVFNEEKIFSLELENSLIYEFREDYSKIPIKITYDDLIIWEGVVDNIVRKENCMLEVSCVESIIQLLSSDDLVYHYQDGYVGELVYAGDEATPAEHQLNILKRFLKPGNIDIGSFKVLKEFWEGNSVQCSCEVIRETKITPLNFIQDLLLECGYITIKNNKVFVKYYENFLGDYGYDIIDDYILNYTIDKEVSDTPYYSFSINYDNDGEVSTIENSIGESGISTDTSSTVLEDSSKDWEINYWREKFVFIGDPNNKIVLKILGNNKTKIYFSGCTKAGQQSYVIVENDKIYYADYSDYPIKISSGVGAIGIKVISKATQFKLSLELELLDYHDIDVGDTITISLKEEGLILQPFEVIELTKQLKSSTIEIICIDKILYPILKDYQVEVLNPPINLRGFRLESDGSAYLSWDQVIGAAYYIVSYGKYSPLHTFQTSDTTDVHITQNLEKWTGYHFWVASVNFIGVKSENSDPLFLDKITQSEGYIDGSLGYFYEDYNSWGILEDYFYSLVYKQLSQGDIQFLLKSSFIGLEGFQKRYNQEYLQDYNDSQSFLNWGVESKKLGRIDFQGISLDSIEFYNDSGVYKLINPMLKKLSLIINETTTIIDSNSIIPDSENWFIKDYDGSYCYYENGEKVIFDINNNNFRNWFNIYILNRLMGIWDFGTGDISVDDDTKIATLIDNDKVWTLNQWSDYYIGIVESVVPLTINWYKIINNEELDSNTTCDNITTVQLIDSSKNWIVDEWVGYYVRINGLIPILITSNTSNTLYFSYNSQIGVFGYEIVDNYPGSYYSFSFDYGEDSLTSQKYIINNEPSLGFDGVILDNLYTSIFNLGTNLSNTDSNDTSDSTEEGFLLDSSKSWVYDEWTGYCISINEGPLLVITGNEENIIYFSGNTTIGSGYSYIIYEKYYYDNGIYFWEAVESFLENIVDIVEYNSYYLLDSWYKAEKGLININANIDKEESYPYFIQKINKRYRNYVSFNLQCYLDTTNIVTKQFNILDWYYLVEQKNLRKISIGSGMVKLLFLGFPYTSKSIISNIVNGLLLTRFSDGIEDKITSTNMKKDQLFYDMIMAGNYYNNKTIGLPDTGYEDSFSQSSYDRYGIILRKFEGAYIFYNPSNEIRSLDYTFNENVVDYYTGEILYYGSTYTLMFSPRDSSIFYKNSGISEDAYNFLTDYLPYSYLDFNCAWIIFTDIGATKINTNSVWLENGYTHNKRYMAEDFVKLEDTSKDRLFHAGNGVNTFVKSQNPINENIIGGNEGDSIQLSSLTLLDVVKIIEGTGWTTEYEGTGDYYAGYYLQVNYQFPENIIGYYITIDNQVTTYQITNQIYYASYGYTRLYWTDPNSPNPTPVSKDYQISQDPTTNDLTAGEDYLVEQKEWDVTSIGKGKWKTYIYFLTDQSGKSLNVYYYEKGVDTYGWPKTLNPEDSYIHGLLYRRNENFVLKTGSISELGCNYTLVKKLDYYIIPECTRWRWDYRIKPFGTFLEDKIFSPTINLNMIYEVGGNTSIKAINGFIDPDNTILINSDENTYNSINGKKALYSSLDISKPKILIYGFRKTVRDNDLNPIEPNSRILDEDSIEYELKTLEDIYYDNVIITGDWDGVIETGSSLGSYGSIEGILNDTYSGFSTWEDIADFFDVIIINDTFKEYSSESISGCSQDSSWLKLNDYNLIKNFKKRANNNERDVLLIDRKYGATAFVWYGGIKPIRNLLLNKGSSLTGGSTKYSDLTDVFGVYAYKEVNFSDLRNSFSNLYIKSLGEEYIKFSSSYKTDFRIGHIIKEIDHYSFDEEESQNHPKYNPFKNGEDSFFYIPKSNDGRGYFNSSEILFEESKLFLQWKDLTSLVSGEDNFDKYEQIYLNNIILKRIPLLIYHKMIPAFLAYDTKTFGLQTTSMSSSKTSSQGNYYRGCQIIKEDSGDFLVGKYIYLKESKETDYKETFTLSSIRWEGFIGFLITSVEENYQSILPYEDYVDYGWIIKDKHTDFGIFTYPGFIFAGGIGTGEELYKPRVEWGDTINFRSYDSILGEYYNISKSQTSKGCIPYIRESPPTLEGSILQIDDNGDNTLTIHVNFDVNNIDIGLAVNSGTITSGKWWTYGVGKDVIVKTNLDLRPYRDKGYYAHIETSTGTLIKKISLDTSRGVDADSYGVSIKNNEFCIKKGDRHPSNYDGLNFEVRESENSYKICMVRTDSENNIVFNASIIEKNNSNNTLKIYLPRGEEQLSTGGYLLAYGAEEDTEITIDNFITTDLSNRDVFGGRISGTTDTVGSDIYKDYLPEGSINPLYPRSTLESLPIKNKPSSMIHYEWVYGSLIKEFGYEFNTGLITCQCFYPYGVMYRPPVFIFPEISCNDIQQIINKQIGTKLTFNNLQVSEGDILYLYYNTFNDIIRIKTQDVENPLTSFYKFEGLKSTDETLLSSLVKNKIS
jgi:hypothetical protein